MSQSAAVSLSVPDGLCIRVRGSFASVLPGQFISARRSVHHGERVICISATRSFSRGAPTFIGPA